MALMFRTWATEKMSVVSQRARCVKHGEADTWYAEVGDDVNELIEKLGHHKRDKCIFLSEHCLPSLMRQ